MAAPTDYVIKVYTSEQHAIEGGTTNALEVVSSSDNRIITNGQDNFAYYTHQKYFYRIECNDNDVKEVYIDWGDGNDRNPKTGANYQFVEVKNNENFVVVDHIYTDHDLFFPIIKTVNKEGFESKYYTASYGADTGIQQVTTIACTDEDANTDLHGKFFDLFVNDAYGKITPHRFFYDVDGQDVNSVTIPDGYEAVKITAVNDNDNATAVGIATEAKIEAVTGLTSTESSGTITVTNSNDGNVPFPNAGTSGFGFSVTTYGAKNDYQTLDPNLLNDDINFHRWVQIDSAVNPRIPSFSPSASPPVGVLKVNRTEVKAGIDNDVVSSFTNPVGYVYMDGKDAYDNNGNLSGYREADVDSAAGYVTVTYKDTSGRIISEDLKASTKVGGSTLAAAKFPANYASAANYISEILEVRLNDLREGDTNNLTRLFPKEKIHILIRHATTSNAVSPITDSTVNTTLAACQISLGNPIVTAKSVETNIVADGSESYTLHSNEHIKKWRFDTSKGTDSASTVAIAGSISTQNTDILSNNEQETPVKEISYTFDYLRHDQTDVHNRFYPTEKLIRLQVVSNSDDNRVDDNDLYHTSHIDGWSAAYDGTDAQHPKSLRSKALLQFFTEANGDANEWTDMTSINRNNTGSIFGDGRDDSVDSLKSATPLGSGPDNYLLMVDKYNTFNKLHFRMENEPNAGVSYHSSEADGNQAKISFLYSTSNGWKPLKFRDHTITKNDDATKHKSLTTSGTVTFDMPVDWERVDHQDLEIVKRSTLIGDETTDDNDSDDPESDWTFTGYALLMGIDVSSVSPNEFVQCKRVHRFDNTFSQVIRLVDPMHISINSVGVSQSISYNRQGTFVTLDDRMGKREIKRIGANGGNIKFGGVDLGDTVRDVIITHQKNANPIYYDFKRPDGTFIRFYGVITEVSEDLPVGLQHPKFGVSMSVESIIEFSSTGTWVRQQSLGGDIIDEPTFI